MAAQNGNTNGLNGGASTSTTFHIHNLSTDLHIPIPSSLTSSPSSNHVLHQLSEDFSNFASSPDRAPEEVRLALLIDEKPVDDEEEGNGPTEGDRKLKLEREKREREVVLEAIWLGYLSSKVSTSSTIEAKSKSIESELLLHSFNHFVSCHLSPTSSDLHNFLTDLALTIDRRNLVVRSFYVARSLIGNGSGEGKADLAVEPRSKLILGGEEGIRLSAVFGGQGTNEVYFDELQSLYDLYPTLLGPFLSHLSVHLSKLSEAHRQKTLLYNHGLDFFSWLRTPSFPTLADHEGKDRPPLDYLVSCAVSLPLIGVVQLAWWVVVGKVLGLSPSELVDKFAVGGTTGHSQGVVSACIVSIVKQGDSWEGEGGPGFLEVASKGLEVLFYIGLRATEAYPPTTLPPNLTDPVKETEGLPTPMLSVTGLTQDLLEKKISATNKDLGPNAREEDKVEIRLKNGLRNFVVVGNPKTLVGLVLGLRKGRAEQGKDQSKIPFSKRLPVFSVRFLPIGLPYHSSLLRGCTQKVITEDLSSSLSFWDRKSLRTPVWNTKTGRNLQDPDSEGKTENLLEELCSLIFEEEIEWLKAVNNPSSKPTHIVDFGPGGISGIGGLTARGLEGKGVRLVIVGKAGFGEEVWDSRKVRSEEEWERKWRVGLVKTSDGKLKIDTPMSRLLSKPPLMVAGMTPSTVQAGFNAAVLNAGYHIELAGGGHYNAAAVRSKVSEILGQLETPGLGITLNSLYINQKQWTFQLPLWIEMKKEGLPIEGLCVAAGIPSTEKAKEIIDGLRGAGIKHVSFKPGSVDGIRQVCNIAGANPDFPIICQWTGGRAGGHHSPEDMHQPILSTYATIRKHPNIVLVGGGGFGASDGSDILPYLTGEWSVKFGAAPMPFDGVLYASRVMVAKEAHTSEPCKELIVKCAGVDDEKWEGTYDRETGGILTVQSELGEPIHKVATRGIKLWKEFDKTVFALPREKRAAWFAEAGRKDYVIKKLNADFQKPWFAASLDGSVLPDLGDMTYEEVARRLVRLTYVQHQSRWGHLSWRALVGDWLRITEARLAGVNGGGPKASILQSFSDLDPPSEFLTTFFENYPAAKDQLIASEDIKHFLALCQRPGQKPVPFIPVLDGSFEVWFKKDSLGYSEDLDAVFDQDPQRVCILQGPVAVKHSKRTDQPIKELLGEIEEGLISKLLEKYYNNDESEVPTVDYLTRHVSQAVKAVPTIGSVRVLPSGIKHSISAGPDDSSIVHTYEIPASKGDLPSTDSWLDELSGGPSANWLKAFLTSPVYVREKGYTDNVAKKVLAPRKGQKVVLTIGKEKGEPRNIKVYGAIRASA